MVKGKGPAYNRVYGNKNSENGETIKVNPKRNSNNSQSIETEGVQVFKPATTVRGLVWRIKRWFYANLRKFEKEFKGEFDSETSKYIWKETATQIVEYNQKQGLSDNPAKGFVEWAIDEFEGKKVFVIKKITIQYFEVVKEQEFTIELE